MRPACAPVGSPCSMNTCAVHDRGVVAVGALHVAAGAGREVVHVLGQRQRERVEVDAR